MKRLSVLGGDGEERGGALQWLRGGCERGRDLQRAGVRGIWFGDVVIK